MKIFQHQPTKMQAQVAVPIKHSSETPAPKLIAPTVWGFTPSHLANFFWIIIGVGVLDCALLGTYTQIYPQSGTHTQFTVIDDLFVLGTELLALPICLFTWKKLCLLRAQHAHAIPPRLLLAVLCLGLAALFDVIGQSYWIFNDAFARTLLYPSVAELFFNLNNIFFLPGVLLLMSGGASVVGRTRILLDAGTIVFSFMALFWYFWLGPTLVGLSGDWLAKLASLSLPAFDLLIVMTLTFLLFNPFSSITLHSTLTKLSIGVGCLAVTDFVYGYLQVSDSYHSGMLVDIGWPIARLFIGWAILTYPDDLIASMTVSQFKARTLRPRRISPTFTTVLQIITPLLFTVLTCCLLLIDATRTNTASLMRVVLICAGLFLLPIIRQCITLVDNMILNQRLQVALTRSEQNFSQSQNKLLEATLRAKHLDELRTNIEHLQRVHAHLARGEMDARATVAGPLAPVAQSLNLLIERMARWRQSEQENLLLTSESDQLSSVLDTLAEGHIVTFMPKVRNTSPIGLSLMATVRLQHRLELTFRREQELVTLISKRLHALQWAIEQIQHDAIYPAPLTNSLAQIEKGLTQQQTLLQEMWTQTNIYQSRPGVALGTTRSKVLEHIKSEPDSQKHG